MKRIIGLITIGSLLLTMPLFITGCSETKDIIKADGTNNMNELVMGKYYVWHDEETDNIRDDIKYDENRKLDYYLFTSVYARHSNFDGDSALSSKPKTNRILWIDEEEEKAIPTFYPGDEIVYYTDGTIPESFIIERYLDAGYTFGFSGITKTSLSKKYVFDFDEYSFCLESDIYDKIFSLNESNEQIIIDRIEDVPITDECISYAGTFFGLEKDKEYNLDIYEGTVLNEVKAKADSHALLSYETYKLAQYEFVKSNIITITLPKYLKTGYYFINGTGLFRYIAEGETYDENTDYNQNFFVRKSDDDNDNDAYDYLMEDIVEYNCIDSHSSGSADLTKGTAYIDSLINGVGLALEEEKNEDEIINEVTEEELEVFENYNTTSGYDTAEVYIPEGHSLINIVIHFTKSAITTENMNSTDDIYIASSSTPNGIIISPSNESITAAIDSEFNQLTFVLENPESGIWKVETFNMLGRDFQLDIIFLD